MQNLHGTSLEAIGMANRNAVGTFVHYADVDASLGEGCGRHETGWTSADDEDVDLRVLHWFRSYVWPSKSVCD
jgi:hypothetical protein